MQRKIGGREKRREENKGRREDGEEKGGIRRQ